MEKTKIYLITKSTEYLSQINRNVEQSYGFTMSKILAEYYVWRLNRNSENNSNKFNYTFYKVYEVDFINIEKGKDYSEFIKEAKNRIITEIDEVSIIRESKRILEEKLKADLEEFNLEEK